MNLDLTRTLNKTYNKIFDKDFLFECDDGWYEIISNLCAKIQQECDTTGCEQVKALQVKEKFAALRFYVCGGNENIGKFIDEAFKQSVITCEVTGNYGKLCKRGSWYKTLCNESAVLLGYERVKD